MLRGASALHLILLLAPAHLGAKDLELLPCVAEMADAIRAGTQDGSQLICEEELAPWQATLQHHTVGWMTDGTALGLLHMPQRDDVPQDDWPLPVVLLPRSEHVWYVGSMYKDHILPELVGLRYFLWTPGNSRSGFGPDNVSWGQDSARLFRCLSHDGQSCITYYPVKSCSVEERDEPDSVFVVRRKDDMDPVDLLESFKPADDLLGVLAESAWAAKCRGDK